MAAFLQDSAASLEHRPHDAAPQVGKALQEQRIVGLGLLLPGLREAARLIVPIEHLAQIATQSLRHGILDQSRVLNSTSTRRSRRSSGSPKVPV